MSEFLQTPIEFLKGVGPQRAEILRKEINIKTFGDLLDYYPFRYVDRSYYNKVSELPQSEGFVQLTGKIIRIEEVGLGKQRRLNVKFEDNTGIIDLVWFQGIKWVKPTLILNAVYQVYGKPKIFGNNYSIPHPEILPIQQADPRKGLKAIYSSTEKLAAKGLHSKGI